MATSQERDGDPITVYPLWGKRHNSDDSPDSPWTRKVILSLDGGGVRGYSSLLVLDALMTKVRDLESGQAQTDGSSRHSSSAACLWSDCDGGPDNPFAEKFFMRHYVDYFFGTSTGGLTAIMLGRLKLTIKDAKDKYNDVGEEVFKHHRPFARDAVKLFIPELSSRRMEETLKRATVPPTSRTEGISERAQKGEVNESADSPSLRMRDTNQNSSRTVVVASQGFKPHLFRSYDHPTRTKKSQLKPGPASDTSIWKVGRATSAAPGWFSPFKIDGQTFQDGAVAGYNNPVRIAYEEVKLLFPNTEPKMIISIGTNSKERAEGRHSDGDKWLATWKMTKHQIKEYKNSLLESRLKDQEFREQQQQKRDAGVDTAAYFRFDVPANTPFEKVRLGDWRGEKGQDTIAAITGPTTDYLDTTRVNSDLIACAKLLVEIRRQRAATARWETFALDGRLSYSCPETATCRNLRFDSRYDLRQHAFRSHGFVRRIECIHHARVSRDGTTEMGDGVQNELETRVISWTCLRDDCEEKVYAFDIESDFKSHFHDKHELEERNYSVKSVQDFEEWLDRGRDWNNRPELARTATSHYSTW